MKRFKVWLLLALVFVAGFAGGVVATRMKMRHFVHEAAANPEFVRARVERELFSRLNLDPAQRTQVREILRDSQERLRTTREQIQPEVRLIMRDTHDRIAEVLKPEQREQFEKFLAEKRRPLLPPPLRGGPRTNRLPGGGN